jgi:hypothetical protein
MKEPYWMIGRVTAGNGMAVIKTSTQDFSC